jgi:ubiquinol-cytochrome c reductase cytochrome b subunit
MEAEASFGTYLPQGRNIPTPYFEISQTHEELIIYSIKLFFSITSNVYKGPFSSFRIKTTSKRSIENIIIFMNNAPVSLQGHKKVQYLLFLKELRKLPKFNNIIIPDRYF